MSHTAAISTGRGRGLGPEELLGGCYSTPAASQTPHQCSCEVPAETAGPAEQQQRLVLC